MTGVQQLGTPGHFLLRGTAFACATRWVPSGYQNARTAPRPTDASRPVAGRSAPVRAEPIPDPLI